jgi:signal transduction histidine kinase/DNA-binding response OmpR family regulator
MKKPPPAAAAVGSPLRTRLRIYAAIGLAILGAWLYYTINAVFGLYNTTLAIQRSSQLREQVQDAQSGLSNAEDALERYTAAGEGYDLSRHHSSRAFLRGALGAIRREGRTESYRGLLDRAEAEETLYARAADAALALWSRETPERSRQQRDDVVRPVAEKLREHLTELGNGFSRSQAMAEERLKDNRDAASTALGIMGVLLLVGIVWIVSDVNRRIVTPTIAASRALAELTSGGSPPRLAEQPDDEIGELGRSVNAVANLYGQRGRAMEDLDIQASVNAVLTVTATVNDLSGFGAATMEKIVDVLGASSGILYLPASSGGFEPSVSIGGGEGANAIGREEAARAAAERRPIYLSIDPQTPTVNVLDGRVLPRETVHIPLIYFDHVVGVLALGATQAFTAKARNALTAIAPSLAVALANAAANERVAEQSRRLTEQNELLEEQRSRIARTAEELQHAGALKDRFLASVSHELRTPMTVILGFTGTLLRGSQGELNAPQRESLERVQRNAKLLLALINDILDISKIQAGKLELDTRRISVAAFLGQVETDFREAARKKGLELDVSVSRNLEEVSTDPAKLTQIVTNLVSNALKFTESGSIRIRAEEKGRDAWTLTVSDTGIGIPEAEQSTIFEEFRQGEAPEHRGRGGTGLGLAIVKRLSLLLGGTISLRSARGEGSEFTLSLPRELPVAPAAPEPLVRSERSGSRTVLVIDDDESIRRLLAVELEPYDVRLLEAKDAQEGLRIARSEKPELILLDVLMPGVDGWETLKTLKDSPATRGIPVAVLSVVDNRAFGFALGAFDYLLKPLVRDALFGVLSRAGVLASQGHVLVVDDEADVRTLLEHELVAAGYRARSVPGGAEALAEIERERPAAILLDLLMPPPDGFEVLYRIRERPEWKDIPVIVVTAKELTAADNARLSGSVQRILKKGSDPRAILREVLGALGSPKSAAERVGAL